MKKPKDLATIVIICFNLEKFLGAAIKSALSQTYQPKEVIVADDGSTDASVKIARRFPVKVLALPHQGLSASLNAGFRAARGQYLVRLDGDDILEPRFLELTIKALEQNPKASFVYTCYRAFGAKRKAVCPGSFEPKRLLEANYIPATATLRAGVFKKVGGYSKALDELIYEDWNFWLSAAELGFEGILVPKILFRWRRRANSRNLAKRALIRQALKVIWANHPRLFTPEVRRRLWLKRGFKAIRRRLGFSEPEHL